MIISLELSNDFCLETHIGKFKTNMNHEAIGSNYHPCWHVLKEGELDHWKFYKELTHSYVFIFFELSDDVCQRLCIGEFKKYDV